jgi:hypothetical protein
VVQRKHSDEHYVLDLCDKFLGAKSSRQHRFDFLTGDPGKDGKRTRLPVDAYYADLNLVIEYRERHHTEEIPIFDNPSVLTVSGVPRGMQRKQYDQRRRDLLPAHGITLVELEYADFEITKNKRLIRDESSVEIVLRAKLSKHQVSHARGTRR